LVPTPQFDSKTLSSL